MIRIAIIGPEGQFPRILKYSDLREDIELIPYPYKKPEESSNVLKEIINCDVLLFTGPVPYFFAKEKIKHQPALYIPVDEYSLTLSLLDIKLNYNKEFQELSIDVPKEDYIRQVADELKIDSSSWFVKDYSQIINNEGTLFDTDDIIRFHQELWEQKKISLVLTSIDYVYVHLQKQGIPCLNMSIPEKSVKDTLVKAIGYGDLLISQHAQIAVGFLSINQSSEVEKSGSDSLNFNFDLLFQELINITHKIDASVQQLSPYQFMLYGTRGGIEYLTNSNENRDILTKMEQIVGCTINIGFGFGRTAKEAEANANIALLHAKEIPNKSTAFIVTEEKKVLGPINGEKKNYQLKTEDKQILNIAKETGTSVATITKLIEWASIRKQTSFTAHELAEYLQVTRRSAERILKKLLDHHFVKIVGEEQPFLKGRPRSVYKMNMY
ncbi:transcriptional regulator [Peribacillus cavernae]|uniref:Transcriptional regulator n=1 Tax=Peribacillus cavernae TaxID=1674310 RepID=A0A433HBV7_9BACI|nr:transcriptional regulator [Peribacillus cavernae]MDQ0221043.1 putative transcriptional regulator [Peribacillus cavernae]RUQ25819.1 transcriptional regulator [Peribacillus cavernae]